MKRGGFVFLSAACVLFAGCGGNLPPAGDPHGRRSDPGGAPAPMEEVLFVEREPSVPDLSSRGAPVSVQADGADVRDLLAAITAKAGLELILDPDVSGRVTLTVDDVPVEEALDAILSQAGFHYRLRDGLLRVFGDGLQTRIFTVDYIMGVRTGTTRLSASSGGMQRGSDASSGSSESSSGESRVSIDSEIASDLWAELVRGLQLIVLGREQDGASFSSDSPADPASKNRLVINAHTGTVLVTAPFAVLNQVADFLERTVGAAHRQVMIEARVVEVALSDESHRGIDWSRIPGTGSVTSVYGKDEVGVAQHLSPENEAFQIAFSKGEFDVLLDALAVQGEIRVVSSPRIATLNNQKAIIKVAREASFFSQRIDYEVRPDGTSVPIFTVEPERVTIGLILDVTPQVGANGDIMMTIHPSITELVGEDVFPPGASGRDVLANSPVLDIREVDTVVRVRSGNLLLIGGLLKERDRETLQMVPVLGKIPVLGHLFRRTDRIKERVELLIALRPRIVVGEEASEETLLEIERLEGAWAR